MNLTLISQIKADTYLSCCVCNQTFLGHPVYLPSQNGGQHYLRTSGISQGSSVSSLLCSYFYAHMEKCRLAGLDKDGVSIQGLYSLEHPVYLKEWWSALSQDIRDQSRVIYLLSAM